MIIGLTESAKLLTKLITRQHKQQGLKSYVYPVIGDRAIATIKPSDISSIIKPLIAAKKLEVAHRTRAEVSAIFVYAIAHDFAEFDPAQLPARKTKHQAAIIDPGLLGQLLRDIENYPGSLVVKCALRLRPLLFQRPGEIRQMQWADIHVDACEWR